MKLRRPPLLFVVVGVGLPIGAWLLGRVESSGRITDDASRDRPEKPALSQGSEPMFTELLSPELALVDPELRARARAALPDRSEPVPRAPTRSIPPKARPASRRHRRTVRQPLWARIAATLWLLIAGILIGGAAVPHAQDTPRVVPPNEDTSICERPAEQSTPRLPRVSPAERLPGTPLGRAAA
jgi:hypothetical protein